MTHHRCVRDVGGVGGERVEDRLVLARPALLSADLGAPPARSWRGSLGPTGPRSAASSTIRHGHRIAEFPRRPLPSTPNTQHCQRILTPWSVAREVGRFQCAVDTADPCRPRRRNSATSVCGERVCRAGCSQPQDQRDRGETGIADGSDAGVWRVVVGEGRLRSSASHPLSRSRSAASARPPPRSPNRRFANSR
jgi:hypothetical protein